MHRGDDRLGAMASRISGKRVDDPDAERQGERQPDEGWHPVRRERVRPGTRSFEGPEKDTRAQTYAHASRRTEQRPFERADQEGRMFRVPATLVRETGRVVTRNEAAEASP